MLRAGACVLALAALLAACDPAPQAAEQEAVVLGEDALNSEATPAYVGTWAPDAASCALPQEAQGAPYVFTADGFDQHEAHCSFAAAMVLGENDWRVGATCTVEGDEQNTAFDLTLVDDTLRIDRGPPLVRCPQQ